MIRARAALPVPPWTLLALALAALISRGICCLVTLAPDRDTAHYVHMAKTLRAGDWRGALSDVFPPLYPAVLAALGPLGGAGPRAWWASGQLVATVLDVLAVLLMVIAVSPALGPAAALVAGTWLAAGLLPAWQAGDAMSEPCFRALLSLWLLAWLRGGQRYSWSLPLIAALLLLTRTEGGILLLPAAWRLLRGGRSLAVFLAGLSPAALYLWLRASATGSFELLPLASFMRPLSVFAEADLQAAVGHYLREALNLARRGFDGLGYLAYPCCIAGGLLLVARGKAARWQPRGLVELRWPLLAAGLALAVVPLYFGNRRFWTPWLPLLLPLAAVPVVVLATKVRITIGVTFVLLGGGVSGLTDCGTAGAAAQPESRAIATRVARGRAYCQRVVVLMVILRVPHRRESRSRQPSARSRPPGCPPLQALPPAGLVP
ncbi:MAG: hypothetical protein ACE5F1_12950, partial [Planctomycetota bacterium]